MCYCGCQYESYTKGWNEGCACRKPKGIPCTMEIDEEEAERLNEEAEYDEDEYDDE